LSLTLMTAALTPALTLDYLHALSADLRAAVVLDARGERLAGPPALADVARDMLAELAGPTLFEGTTDAGSVFAARDDRHAIVVVTGPQALSRLSRHDLRSALAALGGVNVVDSPPTRLSHGAVSALLDAADDRFRRPRAV
jgi:hypothetical protein